MPSIRSANAVRLEFPPGGLVHTNLSGTACTGEWLWVVGDEGPASNASAGWNRSARSACATAVPAHFRWRPCSTR
ncbi:DUF3616 domain-containing protein [Pseudorhodoferax soli]|uniref:Uncharacterized protein n=1 Tax=Pseudorhodoferax soli TaxID=545864 RepID=A0A368XQG4_9BURK|nr:DUF3616 domain-containing protein [Pseudorhodoferax soli]RCW69268.1 hypothetical protein DES41_106139 [Pseudorhodoferax soli]